MVFETKRTSVRKFILDDFEEVFLMMSDEETMRYTGFRVAQTKEQTRQKLESWVNEEISPYGTWAITLKESGSVIGWFMLKFTDQKEPELGFMLEKSFRGYGYVTEVGKAAIQYAKDVIGTPDVIARTDEANKASQKVLVNLGMKHSKDLSDEGTYYYQITF
jgi:RimJ/RimL family protein N-acetyltransferase